jgi:farnesyl-diphosphate farnesyltransferase
MSERAVRHLDSGIEFVLLLPRRHPRIRLFCLWPLLLAVRTLTRLVTDESLLERRVKISREEVNELTREATWRCISNSALRKLYERERNALHAAMRTTAGTLRP